MKYPLSIMKTGTPKRAAALKDTPQGMVMSAACIITTKKAAISRAASAPDMREPMRA